MQMACRRAMRSSVEGCVENRRMMLWPVKGLMMNMWAVEGEASMGICLDQVSSFCRPPISGQGEPTYLALAASASNSREREMAICISIAAMGARIIMAMAATGLPRSSSSRLPPNQKAIRARKVMLPATMAATVLIRISRCSTWPSSWAITPCSSLSAMSRRRPPAAAGGPGGGEGEGGMRRIAAGGEGIGRIVGDNPQFRHGQPHALAKIAHHGRHAGVRLGVFGLRHCLRLVTHERDLVGEKVTHKIHDRRDAERHVETLAPGNGLTANQENGGQEAEKRGGFQCIHIRRVAFQAAMPPFPGACFAAMFTSVPRRSPPPPGRGLT